MSGKLFRPGSSEEITTFPAEMLARSGERRPSQLEERARIRNAIFRMPEFGAEEHTASKDEWYRPSNRKNTGSVDDRAKVTQLARCVDISFIYKEATQPVAVRTRQSTRQGGVTAI